MSLSNDELLSSLFDMVQSVNQVNGANEKVQRLANYPSLAPFLKLLMDPLQTTGVTSAQIKKYAKSGGGGGDNDENDDDNNDEKTTRPRKRQKTKHSSSGTEDKKDTITSERKRKNNSHIIDLLNKLYTREYSGNEAKQRVIDFIQNQDDKYKPLLYKIIDKNLEIRMGIKQINEAFPNLISEFSVSLAKDFQAGEKHFRKTLLSTPWLISRKFDGIRTIVFCNHGQVEAYSRNGNRFPALAPLEELLQPFCKNVNIVLDGEICYVDEKGQESFTEAVSRAKRKSVRMETFRFYIFDLLNRSDFEQGLSQECFSARHQKLKEFVKMCAENNNNISSSLRVVDQIPYSEQVFEDMKKQSVEENWEGLMLRLDTSYKGKRSNDLLKYKNFQTEEYVVQSIDSGPFRHIDPNTGLEATKNVLTSVTIKHKDNLVGVGSGFTFDQRQHYFDHPEDIIGKTISVRFFEETVDAKTKKCSLRFPTFLHCHE
jgi:ATP-dependent DNA ligase